MDDPQVQSNPTYTVGDPKNIPGMIEPGNLDLNNRPVVQNDDGSHSSEYSTSFGDEKGREILVPTVVNGRFLTPNGKKPKPGSKEEKELFKQAQKHYEKTHEHLGIFDKPEHADAYAELVHNRNQGKMGDSSEIPQPVTSGATDNPNAPQSGTSDVSQIQLPPGASDTRPQIELPPGASETRPVQTPDQSTEKKSVPFGQDDPTGMADLGVGMAKSAGQTVSTVANFLNRAAHPESGFKTTGDKIDIGLKKLEEAVKLNPNSVGEHVGGLLEGIGEFVLGGEALKSLSLGERLGIAQKITDIGAKYPYVAKLIGRGIQAVENATLGGGEAALKGENVKTGALAGAIVPEVISGAVAGAGKVAGKINGIRQAAARTTQELQPEFQREIKNLVDQVANEHDVPTSKSKTMQTYIQETAQNVEDKAKEIYQKIDQATGENFFQRIEQKLANTKRAIRDLTGTEEDVVKEAKLEKSRTELMDVSNEMWEKAKDKGVTRADYDEAVNTWKQSQALFDLDREINRPNVISGLRPDIATTAQAAANPETVDAGNFFKRVNEMYKDGRLQEAVGPERAKNFLTHTADTMADEAQLMREQAHAEKVIKTAKRVGVGVAGAAGLGGLSMGAGALINSMRKSE